MKRYYTRREVRAFLKLLLVLALLGVIFYLVDFKLLVDTVLNLNPLYLIPVIALIYIERVIAVYKWVPLLRKASVPINIPLLFRTYLVSTLVGMIFPTSIGSDLFRVYSLVRNGADGKAVFASIVAERVIAFVGMLLFVLLSLGIGFYFLRNNFEYFGQVALLLGVAAAIAAGFVAITMGRFRSIADKMAWKLARYPGVGKLHRIYTIYSDYRHHRRTLTAVFLWTLLQQLMPIFSTFFLVRAFNIDATFLELAAVIPMIILGLRLPISFNGLGVQEGLYIGLFLLIDISPTDALLISATTRVLSMLAALPWGIHYIIRTGGASTLLKQPSNSPDKSLLT
ncbi:MAG: flippase-like domain-containing protein [Chloroflexi bacterium]|nr:flippase-like domain-containing protein [Chloroflexota bacterium]